MPDHAKKIFISYRHTDSAAMSSRIYDAMAAQFGRTRVFRDAEDIPVGVRFPAFLQKALLQCTVAFVLIGPTWLQARNPDGTRRLDDPADLVRVEVETALSHGLLVCPLLLDEASMPAVEDLPPSLREVRWRNALPIHSTDAEFAQDMQRLAADIKDAVEGRGGRLIELFALAGRTTALPLAVGAAVGVAASKSGGLGNLLAQGCSSVAARVGAAVLVVAVAGGVLVVVAHPSPPFPARATPPPIVRGATPNSSATVGATATAQPFSPGFVTTYSPPTANSDPVGITRGSDGNLWFTEYAGNQIGRITPSGAITEFPIPTAGSEPGGIISGPDGNLWFTESQANQIGRITPSGAITEFPTPTANSDPVAITRGPDGNLWFTEFYTNQIGRITPSGAITEFPIPTAGSEPGGIISGPDGNLWFTEYAVQANQIGRITPSGAITEFPIPTAGGSGFGITLGSDGNLWFTEYDGHANQIGRITPSGTITEFPIPTASSQPDSITLGPDGNLWFTEYAGNQIGRITPSGAITEFPIPTANSQPGGIISGPDGNLWFTEGIGAIGWMVP